MMFRPPSRRTVIASVVMALFVMYIHDSVANSRRDQSHSEDALNGVHGVAQLNSELAKLKTDFAALQRRTTREDQTSQGAQGSDNSRLLLDMEAKLRASGDGIHDRLARLEAAAANADQLLHTDTKQSGVTRARAGLTSPDSSTNWRHVNCSGLDNQRLIPRIIMQQWHSRSDPRAVIARRVWSRIHPCYEYVMLDNDDIWAYMKTRWPDMIPYLQQGSNIGEKADLIRYLWMYDHGGVYADLDAFALQSLDPLLGDGRTLVVGLEADFKTEKLRDEWLSGAMESATLHCFATSKHNPVLWKVVEKVIRRLQFPIDVDTLMEGRTIGDVGTIRTLHRTGPVPFSEVVLQDDRTTVLGVLALQGGHGNGARYYDMMKPSSLARNIPEGKMNPVYAIHINSGTWLSQSGVDGPPDHYSGLAEGECMHENSMLDVMPPLPGSKEVWSRPVSLPPGVNSENTALVVRSGGLFLVENGFPVAVVLSPDPNSGNAYLQDRLATEVAILVATLKMDKHVSSGHRIFMTQPSNAVPWCKDHGRRNSVCTNILRIMCREDKVYSKKFVGAMLIPWSSSATTFKTSSAHLLTTPEIDPVSASGASPETFVLGGASTCVSVRVCVHRSSCIAGITAEFVVEGQQGQPDSCAGDSTVFTVPTADCIVRVRSRSTNGATHTENCVQQVQFVTRNNVVSPWLGRAGHAQTESEAIAPRGLCLISLWGGRATSRSLFSMWKSSSVNMVIGLGVTFGTPLPIPARDGSSMCLKNAGSGLALFGSNPDKPFVKWTSSHPKPTREEMDTLMLYRDRLVVNRSPVVRGGLAHAKFASVREGMKAVAVMTHAAVAKDVETNRGMRFFPEPRGIVFVSGEGLLPGRPSGIHFSMIYAQLNWLYRVINTTLPTEVWLMTDADYPAGLELNFPLVRFRVLATTNIRDWYDITLPGNFFAGTLSYCTKILAVLASAFEEVILLDNDNFAMIDPRALFEHPQYRATGHLVWADAQPRFINPMTIRMLGLTEDPDELNVHSDGGQIAMSRKRFLPGLTAMFHVGLHLGETEQYFYGDKDLWRLAFMFQHQAPADASYHVPGSFHHVFNFPSWFGDFDFKTRKGGFQRRFHIRGYAQIMTATATAPSFMHFSGGAKLLLLDMAQRGFKRENQWAHFLRITDSSRQIHKNVTALNDLGWCTEAPTDERDILPMPLWIQIKMDWLLDRINESLSVYPVADLRKYILAHTITKEYNGCFH